MLLHTSRWLQWLCCVWLWCWTGWSSSTFSWIGTIWLFSVPQQEKTLGCWEAVSNQQLSWGSVGYFIELNCHQWQLVIHWLYTMVTVLHSQSKSSMSPYLSVNDKLSVMTSSMKCPPPPPPPGWELLYHRNPSAATLMEEVCGLQGRLCWKINHIWLNSTIAS